MQNLPALVEILNEKMRRDTTANWLAKMEAAALRPVGPGIREMHEDPQAVARDMIVETRHAIAGDVKTIGHPVKFSKTPAKVAKAAPVLDSTAGRCWNSWAMIGNGRAPDRKRCGHRGGVRQSVKVKMQIGDGVKLDLDTAQKIVSAALDWRRAHG